MKNDMKVIMESWRKSILSEQESYQDVDGDDWWDGKDVDFLSAATGPFIVFDKEQEYKKEDLTHGLFSHFLKHVKDIGMTQDLNNVVSMFKNAVTSALEKNMELYYFDGSKSVPLTNDIMAKITGKNLQKLVRISLDRINDAIVSGNQVTPEEKDLYTAVYKIAEKYDKISKEVIKAPDAKATSEKDPKKVAFVKDGKLVITYDGKIASAFGDKRCKQKPEACVEKAVGNKMENK